MFSTLQSSWQSDESQASVAVAEHAARNAPATVDSLKRRIQRLEYQVERLTLGCMALAELLRDRLDVPLAVIDAKVEEIDLRDGKRDGKLSQPAPPCPNCHRINSPQRVACLYCGKPLPDEGIFVGRQVRQLLDPA
jgi:hypothetical protein